MFLLNVSVQGSCEFTHVHKCQTWCLIYSQENILRNSIGKVEGKMSEGVMFPVTSVKIIK